MYYISKFIKKHEIYYPIALLEIKSGHKRSHWMWYIFPQLKDLGHSSTSKYYGLEGKKEVLEYMNNSYLKNNMLEICEELYKLNENIEDIFEYPDYLKLNSSMTLFEYSFPNEKIFSKIINKFYKGKRDEKSLNILNNQH